MIRIRYIRRAVAALAGLAIVLLAGGATRAFAMVVPAGAGAGGGNVPPAIHTVTRTVVTGGMPGWQIALIAVGAAVLAAALAVLADRVLAARRRIVARAA
jgi:hypothetical protein